MPKAIVFTLLMTLGCDDGVARVAREAADRQAKQNETMAALHQEVAAGARKLVEGETAARQQALKVHQDLQAERGQLAKGWNNLEAERQGIAASRRIDSLVAATLQASAATIATIAALAFAYAALFGLSRDDASTTDACGLLLEQLLAPPPEPDRWNEAIGENLLGARLRMLPPATESGHSQDGDMGDET